MIYLACNNPVCKATLACIPQPDDYLADDELTAERVLSRTVICLHCGANYVVEPQGYGYRLSNYSLKMATLVGFNGRAVDIWKTVSKFLAQNRRASL